MSNRWLRMDATVLENKRKRKAEEEITKMKQEGKRQQLKQNQQQRYQTAINKCLHTKQQLTSADYNAMLKQATLKGDSPIRKSKEQIMQQLKRRFHRLETYLPSSCIRDIHKHLSETAFTAKRGKSDLSTEGKPQNENLPPAEGYAHIVPAMSTNRTSIAGTSELENDDTCREVIQSMLSLAGDAVTFQI